MTLTEFGKFTRKLRIDNDELLKDMSDKLGVTSSYLSAVEIGDRNIPKTWKDSLVKIYALSDDKASELERAIIYSRKTILINTEGFSKDDKDLLFLLADTLYKVSNEDKEALRNILYMYK